MVVQILSLLKPTQTLIQISRARESCVQYVWQPDVGRLPSAARLLSFISKTADPDSGRVVASLDRKRLGQILGASGMTIRGVFDEETRRKALAFAADAVRYGI